MARVSVLSRLFHSRLFFAACVLLVGVGGLAVARQVLRNRDIARDISLLESRARTLEQDNIRIGDLQQALQTESELEKEARLKLGLKKPGEHVAIVQDQTPKPAVFRSLEELTGEGAASAQIRAANPVRWWYFFFNRRRYQELVSYAP